MSLTIEKQKAKKLYPEAPEWLRKELEEEFGVDYFKVADFERIETFDDACRACGTTEAEFNEKFAKLGLDDDTLKYEMIKIVAKAIRGDWKPDWNNSNQRKWFPVFLLSSGFGFSYSAYYITLTDSRVGSRLCFETCEQSDHAGNQFLSIYKALLT